MKKAILILDEMPENCGSCDLCVRDVRDYDDYYGKVWRCEAEQRQADVNDSKRPVWCPLERVPEPKTIMDVLYSGCINGCFDVTEAYREGWNDCLDEIVEGE